MPRFAELPSIARRKFGPREDSKIEEKDLYFKKFNISNNTWQLRSLHICNSNSITWNYIRLITVLILNINHEISIGLLIKSLTRIPTISILNFVISIKDLHTCLFFIFVKRIYHKKFVIPTLYPPKKGCMLENI